MTFTDRLLNAFDKPRKPNDFDKFLDELTEAGEPLTAAYYSAKTSRKTYIGPRCVADHVAIVRHQLWTKQGGYAREYLHTLAMAVDEGDTFYVGNEGGL